MNKGVEKMYKRDEYYNSRVSPLELQEYIDEAYQGEGGLVKSLMRHCVREMIVRTRHEVDIANSELWSLDNWPEDQGFQSSDRAYYIRNIIETTDFDRKFLQAEQELITINRLTECPKNDTVRKYMAMNEKLKEGMVA
jgi:hypothetical protein